MDTGDEVTGPVNLGNPVEFSIRELAEKVLHLTGSRSTARVRAAARPTIPMQRRPDISRARELLGWEPDDHARSGLERTIRYFRDLLRAG